MKVVIRVRSSANDEAVQHFFGHFAIINVTDIFLRVAFHLDSHSYIREWQLYCFGVLLLSTVTHCSSIL